MFEVNFGSVGSVNVVSSDNGGLSNDQIAEMAANKIMYISDEAPEPIRLQAEAFKDQVFHAVKYYMDEAVKSDRTTLIAQLELNGHKDMADILRRL